MASSQYLSYYRVEKAKKLLEDNYSVVNVAVFSMRVIEMMLKCEKIMRYRRAFRKKRR